MKPPTIYRAPRQTQVAAERLFIFQTVRKKLVITVVLAIADTNQTHRGNVYAQPFVPTLIPEHFRPTLTTQHQLVPLAG